jgi:hypothetical protein
MNFFALTLSIWTFLAIRFFMLSPSFGCYPLDFRFTYIAYFKEEMSSFQNRFFIKPEYLAMRVLSFLDKSSDLGLRSFREVWPDLG